MINDDDSNLEEKNEVPGERNLGATGLPNSAKNDSTSETSLDSGFSSKTATTEESTVGLPAFVAGAAGLLAASCQAPGDGEAVDGSDHSPNESSSDGSGEDDDDVDDTGSQSPSESSDDGDDDDDDSGDDDDDDDGQMKLDVNGKKYVVDADPNRTLLDILRHELRLTGTKYGCGEGQCGACTVRMNGTAIRSCLLPLQSCWGKKIQTIEGLEQSGQLHPVQQAFIDEGAMQCGYCTAGMIMSAVSVLDTNADPSDEQIIAGMTGNICRCGTYPRIVKAIKRAALAPKGE